MATRGAKILLGGIHISPKRATEVLEFHCLIRSMVTTTLHFIDTYKLETLTGPFAHSHKNIYQSMEIPASTSDLHRVAAMDSIAQRHVSIYENFRWMKESFGSDAFAVNNPFLPESLQDRHFFAHRWQVWVGEKSAFREEKGVFPTIAKDYRITLQNLDHSIKDVKTALEGANNEGLEPTKKQPSVITHASNVA
jgi:hypothetical protein